MLHIMWSTENNLSKTTTTVKMLACKIKTWFSGANLMAIVKRTICYH